jgi:hypothetical protein
MGEIYITRKGGGAGDATPPTPNVFLNATGGTTLEYNLNDKRYRSHTFTSNGTFEVTSLSELEDFNKVDYLIIAGGGGGGGSNTGVAGGGGGAGGFRTTVQPVPGNQLPDTKPIVEVTSYQVTIGAGGSSVAGNIQGSNGSPSSFFDISSTGGGGGGRKFLAGNGGGSGGGSGVDMGSVTGGLGILGQGNHGGGSTNQNAGGGGGGAGDRGEAASINQATPGGAGLSNILRNGFFEIRAAGGVGGPSGSGAIPIINGPNNSGNGGSGNRVNLATGAGGSGIVVIRYEIAPSV